MGWLFELHKTQPASNIAGADAPTVACATVYPLTTLVRILSAQVLAIALFQ
jgi:putative transport protein